MTPVADFSSPEAMTPGANLSLVSLTPLVTSFQRFSLTTGINDGGKFATGVNSRMPQNSMNTKKRRNTSQSRDANISGYTRSRRDVSNSRNPATAEKQCCTLSCEYLGKFSKKLHYWWLGGKIHFKKPETKNLVALSL
jgi:hypothetical protein